jgi:hypothetical protein
MLAGFGGWLIAARTREILTMKTYEFIVTLAEGTEHTDELAEALYEAGCDDGSVWSSGGRVQIGFTRRAESLEPAIRSASGDVQKAGSTVVQVTIEEGSLAALASMA